MAGWRRVARYARSWKAGSPAVVSTQVPIHRDGVKVPATFVRPRVAHGRLRCWIAIGGVSRMGRFHPQLKRFTEALASTGVGVLVPSLPEWRRLSVSPRVTLPTIRAAVEHLSQRREVVPGPFGLIGFSFGAAGVALAASQEDLADQISGAVLFGAYCSLDRTLLCMTTGEHEWDRHSHRLQPDPYGRWVVAGNYLTSVPGHEDAADVAMAMRRLAAMSSERRISAWESYHDPMIDAMRGAIPHRRRDLFDVLASATTRTRPPRDECAELAQKLADTCRAVEPQLDPLTSISQVVVPTQVIHGRDDRLIPFTEGIRLMSLLPPRFKRGVTVTGRFDHKGEQASPSRLEQAIETARLLRAVRRLVTTV
jgi:pimeloyl-ACP methyl ester carboxylesterase